MRSLPSSAERRLEELRHELVLDLYLKRGALWDLVREMRVRWDIEATVAIPPPSAEGYYLPPHHPPQTRGDATVDVIGKTYVKRWYAEVRDLHDPLIPEDCRLQMATEDRWGKFLSACVVYDPPVPGLEQFAATGAGAIGFDTYPSPRGDGPRFAMQQSPIVQMRDAEKAQTTESEFYLSVIGELIRRLEAKGEDPQKITNEVLLIGTPEARERWERWAEAQSQNEVRPYIDVGPHTTELDVRHAFRMLRSAQGRRPASGRPSRKLLRSAECAILHVRCGWTYERIAEHFGWLDHTKVSKYIKDGKKVLNL